MWDLLGLGFERVSLALAGRFFTTKPPGEPVAAFSAIHFYEACKTKISPLHLLGEKGTKYKRAPNPS